MAMSQYWSDLEQQEYDPDEFVERLAFRFVEAVSRGMTTVILSSQFIAIKDCHVWPAGTHSEICSKNEVLTIQVKIWRWRWG